MRWRRVAAALLATVLVGAAIVAAITVLTRPNGEPTDTVPPTPVGDPVTYVAIGGAETLGANAEHPIAEAWPQVVFRTALPPQTVFVSLARSGATAAQAGSDQLPLALRLDPDVVTVWLNLDDLAAGVTADDYETALSALVRSLRQGGVARVLVANVPPIDLLPGYPPGLAAAVSLPESIDAYNAAIDRVVRAEGAELVDLHAAGLQAAADGVAADQVAEDGLHPNAKGHAAIAEVFAQVIAAAPVP